MYLLLYAHVPPLPDLLSLTSFPLRGSLEGIDDDDDDDDCSLTLYGTTAAALPSTVARQGHT